MTPPARFEPLPPSIGSPSPFAHDGTVTLKGG
jgi:hypothetical protein